MIQEYQNLSRLQMEQVDKEKTLVVVPLGALEQHGNQAPLGTDTIIADEMKKRIMGKLSLDKSDEVLSGSVLFFPTIPVGYSVEHLSFCGSISFKPQTYYSVLYDIAECLARHGFKHIALLICHGGNRATAEIVSRQIRRDLGIYVYLISSGSFSDPEVKKTITPGNEADFHGGEMETAMVMARDENLVDLKTSSTGHYSISEKGAKLAFFGSTSLPWMGEDFTTDEGKPIGIGGDPSGATAQKGEIILDVSARDAANGIKEIMKFMVTC
ncbi:creatinine amidohydrolase [Butyrivibrio sp. ob235]|uniref:creatininase family protein n=1 Tax=Butyrivibrio sp. ob235 TaxID=1761780 RepID=UPI0008C8F9B1|nr:creatininase family protein [Butyrivibrio sp. ob235]SEL20124.1 creatinine amidohydrolase [Butyrivibrio sp. ob235]